jgi:hypothetical protein
MEELKKNQRARSRRLEVGILQHRCCVCYGQSYPAWKVCEGINCLPLSIVSL